VNVLEYVDSWDEDDYLYIQTSLCPMGNLSTFLNEYGKHYDKLEEAYIWKILADVSDVGVNCFRFRTLPLSHLFNRDFVSSIVMGLSTST
jgi:hypothetical protein